MCVSSACWSLGGWSNLSEATGPDILPFSLFPRWWSEFVVVRLFTGLSLSLFPRPKRIFIARMTHSEERLREIRVDGPATSERRNNRKNMTK